MKKLVTLLALILVAFTACKKGDQTSVDDNYRHIAWNWLPADEKATVTINWTQAIVDDYSMYQNENAVAVRFRTSDLVLGPIVVYIDPSTKVVLGQAMRE